MPLPKTGTITLSAVNEEFRKPFLTGRDVELEKFYRGGGIVKTIPKNMQVPTQPPIGLDNLHWARYYYMQVAFNVTSETPSFPYFRLNDGRVSISVNGVSNDYRIQLGSATAYLFQNSTVHFNNLDNATYDAVISDQENLTSYFFRIHVGMGSGSYTQYTRGRGYTKYVFGDGGSFVRDIAGKYYGFGIPHMIG